MPKIWEYLVWAENVCVFFLFARDDDAIYATPITTTHDLIPYAKNENNWR